MGFKYEYAKVTQTLDKLPVTIATLSDAVEDYTYAIADVQELTSGVQCCYNCFTDERSLVGVVAVKDKNAKLTDFLLTCDLSVDLTHTALDIDTAFKHNYSLRKQPDNIWSCVQTQNSQTIELDIGLAYDLSVKVHDDNTSLLSGVYEIDQSQPFFVEPHNVYNFSNRVKLYQDIIDGQINCSEHITKLFSMGNETTNVPFKCLSRPTEINYHDGLVELTGHEGKDSEKIPWTTQRYEFIRNLFLEVCAKIVTAPTCQQSSKRTVNLSSEPFGNFQGFDSISSALPCLSKIGKDSLMQIRQFIETLNIYLEQLNDIYDIQTSFAWYKTKVNTFVEMRLKDLTGTEEASTEKGLALRMTKAFCGPYCVSLSTDINKVHSGNQLTSLIDAYNVVELSSLVKLDNDVLGVDVPFFNNADYSNGLFSYNSSVGRGKAAHTIDIDEVCTLFNLQKGKVISRRNILNALDFIFYTWIQNVKNVVFQSDLCHANCHYNQNIIKEYGSEDQCCVCQDCKTTQDVSYISWLDENGLSVLDPNVLSAITSSSCN